jgi:hypothetical protein
MKSPVSIISDLSGDYPLYSLFSKSKILFSYIHMNSNTKIFLTLALLALTSCTDIIWTLKALSVEIDEQITYGKRHFNLYKIHNCDLLKKTMMECDVAYKDDQGKKSDSYIKAFVRLVI